MKKICNVPKKSEPPTFILPVKISWPIFFCGFRGGNEKFVEIRAGSLFCLAASPLDFVVAAAWQAKSLFPFAYLFLIHFFVFVFHVLQHHSTTF